jgi:hypothetical protein
MKKLFLYSLFYCSFTLYGQSEYGSRLYQLRQGGFEINHLTGQGILKEGGHIYFVGNNYQVFGENGYYLRPAIYEILNDSAMNVTRFQLGRPFLSTTATRRLLSKDSLLVFSSSEDGWEYSPQVLYFVNTFNKNTGTITEHSYPFSFTRKYNIYDNLLINDNIYTFGDAAQKVGESIRASIYISKVDEQFNEQRFQIAGGHRGMMDSYFGSVLHDGDQLVLSGAFRDLDRPTSLPELSNFRILKMGLDGTILNEYRDNSDSTGLGRVILKTSDNGYLIFGSKKVLDIYPDIVGLSFGQIYNTIAYKFDSLLNLQWTRLYGEGAVKDGFRTSDGNYILAGNIGGILIPECNCYDFLGWIQKINENGDVLWEKKYRTLNDSIFAISDLNRVIEDDNGDILTLGSSSVSFYGREELGINCWIIRTDANGCINDECLDVTAFTDIVQEAPVLLIYPNPTDNNVSLKLESLKSIMITATITDINGRIKDVLDLKSGATLIVPLSEKYVSGVYFVHLSSMGKRIQSKRFVKL